MLNKSRVGARSVWIPAFAGITYLKMVALISTSECLPIPALRYGFFTTKNPASRLWIR